MSNAMSVFSAPRQCTVCGKLAEFECKDCMDYFDVGLDNIAYCEICLRTVSITVKNLFTIILIISIKCSFFCIVLSLIL